MNYYEARELKSGGWHYTAANRRLGTWPVGDCRDHEPHATSEEAEECFRQYLLGKLVERELRDWTGCEVCDTPTKKQLGTRPPLGQDHALCDEHRTPEQVAELTERPSQIIASY